MLALNDDEVDAIDSSTQRIGIFFRLETDPVVRLWLGVGPCRVASNAMDANGAIYTGFGELNNVPDVDQLINGVATRVEFMVSGVSGRAMQAAVEDARSIQGAACALGVCLFGASWQQLGSPKWVFRGIADYITRNQETAEGGIVRTISLSVGSRFTGRRRRGLSYLTDQDQQLRHPGDRFLERTSLYAQDSNKVWPRFS
jgi:hypothetical protein